MTLNNTPKKITSFILRNLRTIYDSDEKRINLQVDVGDGAEACEGIA